MARRSIKLRKGVFRDTRDGDGLGDTIAKVAENFEEAFELHDADQLGENDLDAHFATIDKEGRRGLAVSYDAMHHGPHRHEVIGDSDRPETVEMIRDDADRMLRVTETDSSEHYGPTSIVPLADDNNLWLIGGYMDGLGAVSVAPDEFGGLWTGALYCKTVVSSERDVGLAVEDTTGRFSWLADDYGGYWHGPNYTEVVFQNDLDLVDWTEDGYGRVGQALDSYGGQWQGGFYSYPLPADNNLNAAVVFLDQFGRAGLGLTNDGQPLGGVFDSIVASSPDIGAVVWEAAGDIYGLIHDEVTQITDTGDNALPRIFDGDKVLWRSVRHGGVPRTFFASYGELPTPRLRYKTHKAFEVHIGSGQSLRDGGEAAGISLTPPHPDHAFKFEGGPLAVADAPLGDTLVPLAEIAAKETASTGVARQFFAGGNLDRKLLMLGAAQGGKTSIALGPGGETGAFENITAQLDRAHVLPGGAHVRWMGWTQAEADNLAGIIGGWTGRTRGILDALNAHVAGRQQDGIRMLIAQSHSAASYRALATRTGWLVPTVQAQICKDNADMFSTGPLYWADCVDHVHLTAASMRRKGCYEGKIMRLVDQGIDWKGTIVDSVNIIGSDIYFNIDVPVGVLDIDPSIVDPGNWGFDLWNPAVPDSVVAGGITAVTFSGDAQIKVTLAAPPTAGWHLGYAFFNGPPLGGLAGPGDPAFFGGRLTGSRGCICDSDTTAAADGSGALVNHLEVFDLTL